MGNAVGVAEKYGESGEPLESPTKVAHKPKPSPTDTNEPSQNPSSIVETKVREEKAPQPSVATDSKVSDTAKQSAANPKGYTENKRTISSDNESDVGSTIRTKAIDESRKEKAEEDLSDESEVDDVEPVDVLLQFIPYYGQGDPSNDAIVRATLSSLSVEDIDSKDEYGNTLLLLACQYRCEDLVRIMLNKGADPNSVNGSGACCLHFACYRESASYQVAKVLLQNGANPDVAESSFGCTPLHYCAGTGDVEFCKLLLSYGAQIDAYDYYNYTCVDYAREAGTPEVTQFLQKRLDKAMNLSKIRSDSSKVPATPDNISNWELHIDPDSGGKYYINIKNGECLWEAELQKRFETNRSFFADPKDSAVSSADSKDSKKVKADSKDAKLVRTKSVAKNSTKIITAPPPSASNKASNKSNELLLLTQSFQARLVAFFGKHDPSRLIEIDKLIEENKGQEKDLLKKLYKEYKVEEDGEFIAFQKKYNEAKGGLSPTSKSRHGKRDSKAVNRILLDADEKVGDMNLIDPALILRLQSDSYNEAKTKYETMLEEEKVNHRTLVSEKDAALAMLQAEVESLQRTKASVEDDNKSLQSHLDRLKSQGGEAIHQVEDELSNAYKLAEDLKANLACAQQELSFEREKLKSLELTLSNLTSGQEEAFARDRAAAEERANAQRERDAQHQQEIHEIEAKAKNTEIRLKTELNQAKSEWNRVEKELMDRYEALKHAKEQEIDALERELAEKKAQFAQEMTAATMTIEDLQKNNAEARRRMEEAESSQQSMQSELAEAKIVQKYNAQLHKDLLREQLARKKLHNDMEDMKGRIRVYVRVRPFSNREKERGCTEAVIKDGKMTVLVKGIGAPDAKKFYDFDQVFGGSEGNSQVDVFRDTKHLIMSVIDGYNVCIFAYGQTGAGKSFTMIGAADIGSCLSESGEFDELAGITPRAVSELFRLLNERTAQVDFVVEVQMFQLYRDGLDDLLADTGKKKKKDEDLVKPATLKITLAEHSPTGLVNVEGATILTATSPAEVMQIFARGSARRTTASTQMNAESSRSHLICSMVVKLTNKRSGNVSVGKLTLVDLAGSERVDKSGATGEVLKEAQSINKSLSALGDVIAALTSGANHIPYRNHPLTMLMSDSLGGNAKTLMFVNTSPADYNNAESNSSLQFASRCKDVTNAVAAGPGVQAAQVSALKKELAKLKKGGVAGKAGLSRPG